jgi:hypothetical protein
MREQVRRSLNDPPITEIWSAKALNDLLADIQKIPAEKRKEGLPGGTLDEDLLKRINVTSGKEGGNVGILKDAMDGRGLSWPFALLDPSLKEDRDRVDSLTREVIQQANAGKIDANIVRELDSNVRRLNTWLYRNVGDLPPTQYIEAKRFLNDFNSALSVMRQPDASNHFTRRYAARGRNVNELVKNMTDLGLQFAPATTGDEAAYVALQRALAAYDSAFQNRLQASP